MLGKLICNKLVSTFRPAYTYTILGDKTFGVKEFFNYCQFNPLFVCRVDPYIDRTLAIFKNCLQPSYRIYLFHEIII